MTHCGWNSTLEAVAGGVPVAGWPQRAEQFLNERLLVDVMGVGVSMLGKGEARRKFREKDIVGRERVQEVVCELMGGGEKAVERRNRAAQYGKMAMEAVAEGGPSDRDMTILIEEIPSDGCKKNNCLNACDLIQLRSRRIIQILLPLSNGCMQFFQLWIFFFEIKMKIKLIKLKCL